MGDKKQISFAAGIISPEFFGRVDQVRTITGCAILRNFIGLKSGGISNRPGSEYRSTLFDPRYAVKTHQWVFNRDQSYLLEFLDQRLAFWRDGDPILEASKNISGLTQASPAVMTVTSHGFSAGDKIYVSGVVGMTPVNGRYFIVGSPTTHTFTLLWAGDGTVFGTALDSTSMTAYASGGTVERVYTITTPYVQADLDTLTFCQSADTMVIFSQSYAPRKLTRTAHTSWTLSVPTYGPGTAFPTGGAASAGAAGTGTFKYMVTAESESTGIESLSGSAHAKTVSGITKANPAVVTTSANHGYLTGDEVIFTTVSGMTELSNRRFKIAVTAVDKFQLVGENSTSYSTFSAASVYLSHINLTTAADPTTAAPITITCDASARQGIRYNVYKELGGIFGYIGSTYALTFSDTNITPDTLSSVPIYREPFQGSGNYPATGTFYQQRLVTGGSTNNPNGGQTSVTNDFFNFSIHSPSQDTDAVIFQTAGYIDQIRAFAAIDKLIVLTSGAEFIISGGGEGNALTPTEVNIKPRTYNGSGALQPLQIDADVLYVQERGQVVRDFYYSVTATGSDGYRGDDRSLFASSLFKGYTIQDWAYQRVPFSIVWAVRDDGTVLGMTYLPDQELFNWQTHDFYGGLAENVCVLPEGDGTAAEDSVYFVVARELEDGSTTRYMERLATRTYTDERNAKFLDSCLTFDGTGTGTVTLTGSGWTNATSLTLTFSLAQTNATVGNEVQVNGEDADGEDTQIRCRIVGVTSTTIVTVIPHATVPVPMRSVAISDWAMAVDTVSGLDHLEGMTVSIYGDGTVVASALNPTAYDTQYTVAAGSITLAGEQRYAVIHVGLPITSDLLTLDIDTPDNASVMSRKKLITAIAVRVAESKSFWIGARQPVDDDTDPIQFLYEPKIRADEAYGVPTYPFTGVLLLRTKARYNTGGRCFVRVLEPSAVSVLNIAESGLI